MEDMVRALAQAPETQQKTMVRERLQMFLKAPEKEAQEGMKAMLIALDKLPEEGRRALVKSRTQCLCEFPEQERMKLMQIHMAASREVPQEVAMADMKTVEAIAPQLSARDQQIVMNAMKQMGK